MENGGKSQRDTSFDIDNYSSRETSLINDRTTFLEQDSATSIMNDSSTKLDSQNKTSLDSEKLIGTILQGENGQYVVEKLLTKAGESKIFLCKKDQKQYIAKIYIGTILLNKEKRKAFLDLLYQQSYPYILSLEDYGTFENMPFDIYPYMKNGDISKADLDLNFIHTVLVPNLNEVLHYVHEKGVIHRDIKPQNILFSDDKQSVKITDFGILSIADGTSSITSTHRTNGYAAPEIYTGVADYGSDYYAMGITLLSVLIHGDVFEGYPEEQIMRNTIYGTIPHLNRKKFSVSEMTLKDRIEGLICGLTIIDIKKRWGYEQVKQWCAGNLHFPEDLEQEEKREFEKPFIWEGNYCYTASSMALALSKSWEKSKRESGRGLFADWLKFYRPDIATDLYYLIENSRWKTETEKDIGLFKVIYTIDSKIKGLHWKGKIFVNFSKLAEELQKGKDESFEQLLSKGGISWYFETIEAHYPVSEELKEIIKEIEKTAKRNSAEAYQRFIFQFLPKDTPRIFSFFGKEFKNTEDFVYRLSYIEFLEQYAKTILSSPIFSAWMWYFGYDDLLVKAKRDLDTLSNETATERLLILLAQCLPKNFVVIFQIAGKKFKNADELVNRLSEFKPLEGYAKTILFSPQFFVWLVHSGYRDLLRKVKKDLDTLSNEDALKRLFILLEQCSGQASVIRKMIIKRKGCEYIFWLQNNLHQYTCLTQKTKELKFRFSDTVVDEFTPVKEIYMKLTELSKMYIEFAEKAYKNPFYFYYGFLSNDDSIEILPTCSGAYFVECDKLLLPIAYMKEREIEISYIKEKMEQYRLEADKVLQGLQISLKFDFKKLETNLKLIGESLEVQLEKLNSSLIDSDEEFDLWAEKNDIKPLEQYKEKKIIREQLYFLLYSMGSCIFSIFFFYMGFLYWQEHKFISAASFICAVCFAGYAIYMFVIGITEKYTLIKKRREFLIKEFDSLKIEFVRYFYEITRKRKQLLDYYNSFEKELSADKNQVELQVNNLIKKIEEISDNGKLFYFKKEKFFTIILGIVIPILVVVFLWQLIMDVFHNYGIENFNMLLNTMIATDIWIWILYFIENNTDNNRLNLKILADKLKQIVEQKNDETALSENKISQDNDEAVPSQNKISEYNDKTNNDSIRDFIIAVIVADILIYIVSFIIGSFLSISLIIGGILLFIFIIYKSTSE